MRRFSLIGRLGPDDKSKIKLVQSDSDVFEIDFLDGDLRMGFGIGHALDQLASLGLQPSEKGIDLVVLAALVNAGDTRVSRKMNAQDGLTREIDLYIPVSTRSAEHTSELQTLMRTSYALFLLHLSLPCVLPLRISVRFCSTPMFSRSISVTVTCTWVASSVSRLTNSPPSACNPRRR